MFTDVCFHFDYRILDELLYFYKVIRKFYNSLFTVTVIPLPHHALHVALLILPDFVNPYPAVHDNPYLVKQCRSRSDGFCRSHLIRIYTFCHSVCEFERKHYMM